MIEIGMDNWTRFTDYRVYEWFWVCLRSWPAERKARLCSLPRARHIPANGSKDLQGSDGPRRFTNEKSGDPGGYPKSHTCFYRLDLPLYDDYEGLERKLRSTIRCVVPLFSVRVCLWGRSYGDGRIWPGARYYRVKMPAFSRAHTHWLGNGFRVCTYQCSFAQFFFPLFYDMISYRPHYCYCTNGKYERLLVPELSPSCSCVILCL